MLTILQIYLQIGCDGRASGGEGRETACTTTTCYGHRGRGYSRGARQGRGRTGRAERVGGAQGSGRHHKQVSDRAPAPLPANAHAHRRREELDDRVPYSNRVPQAHQLEERPARAADRQERKGRRRIGYNRNMTNKINKTNSSLKFV
jgi:hypothetical protein